MAAGGGSSKSAARIIRELRRLGKPENVAGMARYGITPKKALGVAAPELRRIAKEAGKDHALAEALWITGIREAKIVAALVDRPEWVTGEQMERWAADFDSWDVCDGVCCSLFDRTPEAAAKAVQWAAREEEFVKRAGFVVMAALAVHDKKAPDALFECFLPVIAEQAGDGRNFVKKAVNWALRQIGKRNAVLNAAAGRTASALRAQGAPSARWIAADALRELTSPEVRARLEKKRRKGRI